MFECAIGMCGRVLRKVVHGEANKRSRSTVLRTSLMLLASMLVSISAHAACQVGYECVPATLSDWCFIEGVTECPEAPPPCPEYGPGVTGFRTYDDAVAHTVEAIMTCSTAYASVDTYPDGPPTESGVEIWGEMGSTSQLWHFDKHPIGGGTEAAAARFSGGKAVFCPDGFELFMEPDTGKAGCRRGVMSISPKNTGPCCSSPSGGGPLLGNPVNASIGNKVQVETDYVGTGPFPVVFSRTYNSIYSSDISSVGTYWTTNFDKRVLPTSAATKFRVTRGDGRVYVFTLSGNQGIPDADVSDRLTRLVDGSGNPTGWQYLTSSDEVERYDAAGWLQSITNRAGLVQTLTYSNSTTPHLIAPHAGLLLSVADPTGRQLQFTYDAIARIASMAEPNGGVTTYAYTFGTGAVLTSRTDANLKTRTYLYNEPAYTQSTTQPYALTGITDENGARFATFGYDAAGKAALSQHAGGVDALSLSYNPATATTTITDALGTQRTYVSTTQFGVLKPATTTQPCASCAGGVATSSRTYDANGYPNLVTDFNGTVTDFDYDSRGLETKRIDASNDASPPATSAKRTTDTLWNPTFRVPDQRSLKNASGTIETLMKWAYNARGQATARCQIDPAIGGASSYACGSLTNAPAGVRQSTTTYCEQADVTGGTCPLIGLVKSTNGPRPTTDAGMGGLDDSTTYTYYQTDDATCATGGACPHRKGDLWKVTNAFSQVTEYISYDKNGRVTRLKDANGTYTDFVYHARGWLTQRIVRTNSSGTPSLGDAKLQMDYDAVGNVTQVTQPDGTFLTYTYDDAHRLLKITDNQLNAIDYCPDGIGTANCLDAVGNRKIERIKDPGGNIKRELHRVYNQLGQLKRVTNYAGAGVEYSDQAADTASTLVDGYDRNGNRVLRHDNFGITTRQDYDPLNRLKDTIQNAGGTDPATHDTTTAYLYDTRDNLRQVADPDGLNTVYTYDGLNNLTNLSSPDTGGTAYGYDKAGNRISQTDNRVPSVTSTYTYDALNRLTAIAYPTSSLNVTYAYDQADGVTGCSGSFPKGRLTRMTDTSGSTTYCYDRRGNVLKKTQVTDATNLITQYTYSTADKVLTITYPSGAIVTYTRDTLGRVQTITWKANAGATAINLVNSATYYPFGPLNVLTFGNGRTLTKTYDKDYAIDSISGTPAGALTLDFGVDVMGDITSASGTISPPTADRTYQYDPLYRLSTAKTGATSLEAYTYNKTGDRLSASLNGGAAQVYTYATGTHRLASVGGAPRTSDPNGNLTSVPASTFPLVYDDRNRLVQAKTTGLGSPNIYTYAYGGSGERVLKSSGTSAGTIYEALVWDTAGRLLSTHARTDGGSSGSFGAASVTVNATWDEIIYLDSTPVGLARDGVVYYIEADHLGTPRQVIDRTRNVAVWKWDSLGNTFGITAPNQDPDSDLAQFVLNARFPSQYLDAETNLNYNYFRDYESSAGRYIESDPIGLQGGIASYSYVGSTPLVTYDLRGLSSASLGEGLACWKKYSWDQCRQADSCGEAATRYAGGIRPNDFGIGDRRDALRHCYLGCCMRKLLGKDVASQILFDHEVRNPPAPGRECERYQDFYNNQIGFGVAEAGGDCKDCQKAPTLDEAKCLSDGTCR